LARDCAEELIAGYDEVSRSLQRQIAALENQRKHA
jgi:hypothetical protein